MQTGIESWTANQFYATMHTAAFSDGGLIYPAMPLAWTRRLRAMIPARSSAICALSRGEATRAATRAPFPDDNRSLILGWSTLFSQEGEYSPTQPSPPSGTAVPIWCGGWAIARCATRASTHLVPARSRSGVVKGLLGVGLPLILVPLTIPMMTRNIGQALEGGRTITPVRYLWPMLAAPALTASSCLLMALDGSGTMSPSDLLILAGAMIPIRLGMPIGRLLRGHIKPSVLFVLALWRARHAAPGIPLNEVCASSSL